jgi:tripartite-type tricarboxylate transporter receptor subunit TctC
MKAACATRRAFIGQALALGLAGMEAGGARAQPAPPLQRILCSGPAGSIPDTVARRVAEALAPSPARPVLVDNRPGAAGQLAVAALKAGAADGGTALLAQGAIAAVYPYLYPRLAYDPLLDLAPVSLAGEMALALAVGPAVPDSVTDVRGLVAWMQRTPQSANVGSPGTGTLPHLLEAMLFSDTQTAWQHIAYAGGPPAMVDLMGGQIAALVLPEGLFQQHRATGRLRVLATSGAQRTVLMPAVPTLVEQGHARLVVREWFGFFMPGRTPAAAIDAASSALRTALAQPALAAAFADAGMSAVSSTPATMAARIASEQRSWEPVIRALGVKVE